MWNYEDIDWKFKEDCEDRSRNKWIAFASMTHGQRRKFLIEHGLQYRDVPRCRKCHHVFFNCVCTDKIHFKKMKERKALIDASFEEKLKHSKELVFEVIQKSKGKKIYLAYSGGIDSECCVQLFKEHIIRGDVTVITGLTFIDFPETVNRINELEKELKITILRAKPKVTFRQIVGKYGLPMYSRSSSEKSKRIATSRCCDLLKKQPMNRMTKDADALILGLRMDENRYRRMVIMQMGDFFYSKSHKSWRVYPIAYWTIDDVWKFQNMMGFKYNRIYDNTNCKSRGFFKLENGKTYQIRTGCWACPQAVKGGYLVWLERYYPNFYKTLMVDFGLKDTLKNSNL